MEDSSNFLGNNSTPPPEGAPPYKPVKPKWHPTSLQKWIAIIGTIAIFGMVGVYAYVSYLAYDSYNEVARQAQKAEEDMRALEQKRDKSAIEYRNDTFGFSIILNEGWRGYTVNHIKEDIYDLTGKTKTNNGVVDSIQLIELHHPLETAENPREDMPIMIFTLEQWTHIQNEEWSAGAAPIPPSLLGQNSQWIMALPARYNYDFKPGWEEVDELVHNLKTFEPTLDTYNWQTYRNEEYGFEFRYPREWKTLDRGHDINLAKISIDENNLMTVSKDMFFGKNESAQSVDYFKKGATRLNNIQLAGRAWEVFYNSEENPDELGDFRETIILITPFNGREFTIKLVPESDLIFDSEFTQILSTFRFVK